jgi:hypothetical protein
MESSVPGYTVRALKVREMRELQKARTAPDADEQDVSFFMAAKAIEKDGVSIGAEALNDLEWPVFQLLLKDVLRANGVGDDDEVDAPKGSAPSISASTH